MTVSPILNSIAATIAQQSTPVSVSASAQLAAVGTTTATSASGASDVSPAQSTVQAASLLNISSSVAQLSSLLQVAQAGTTQISTILEQLQSLADQASSSSDPSVATNITSIQVQFEQLLSQVQQTATNTTFGGTSLLDGTSSGSSDGDTLTSALGGQGSLSLPNLSLQALFGNTTPSVANGQSAAAASAAIATGQDTVSNAFNAIGNTQAQLSFAAAGIGTALANNDAATSTLTEEDLNNVGVSDIFAAILGSSSSAVQAQTGSLPSNLLGLVQE